MPYPVKWASTIALSARLEDAVDEALDGLDLGGEDPDLIVAFASSEHGDHFTRLPKSVASRYPNAQLVGCSAGGVIGGGREVEGEAGLALLGARLPGVDIHPFHLGSDPEKWQSELGLGDDAKPDFVILPDPYTSNPEFLVSWLDRQYPESVKIGGLVSGSDQPGESGLFIGNELHRSGAAGIAFSGNLEVDTVVAQGCRPIGSPLFVTRAQDHVIHELDGRPALAVIEQLVSQLPPEDKQLVSTSLFIGLVMRDQQEVYEQGDFLVRQILGVDPESGAVGVAASLGANQVVQFQLRDARASADDLEQLLSRHQYASPAGALLFSCLGRGRHLYGKPDHDSQLFQKQMGPVPLAGFFCGGEIGPVHGQTFIHGYTSSFGLFRPRFTAAAPAPD